MQQLFLKPGNGARLLFADCLPDPFSDRTCWTFLQINAVQTINRPQEEFNLEAFQFGSIFFTRSQS